MILKISFQQKSNKRSTTGSTVLGRLCVCFFQLKREYIWREKRTKLLENRTYDTMIMIMMNSRRLLLLTTMFLMLQLLFISIVHSFIIVPVVPIVNHIQIQQQSSLQIGSIQHLAISLFAGSNSKRHRTATTSRSMTTMTMTMTTTNDDENNTNEINIKNKQKNYKIQMLQGILWDMDGVLADTERDGHRVAFNKVFEEYNLNTIWNIEEYGSLLEIGGGKERMTHYWNNVVQSWPITPLLQENTDIDMKIKQQNFVKILHERKTEIFMTMINDNTIPVRSGVVRIIDNAITNNIQLAVCSTSTILAVQNLVRTLFGQERYEKFTIFAGDMVSKKKPSPDIYNLAITTLNLIQEHCIIIEDSSIGCQSAKGANINCIITKSSYTQNENFTSASLIVNELGDDILSSNTIVTLQTMDEILIKSAKETGYGSIFMSSTPSATNRNTIQ